MLNRIFPALLVFLLLGLVSNTILADEKQLPPNSVWPHSISDLPADPAVNFATLPNGMRYAILKNFTPPSQVSFRLRIGVGSIQESENEKGMAHFLEHLAFRGSTHVPDKEVFHRMERLGAALGADTNAFTSQTETVYKFDLPKADDESIDTALNLMRETGSELLIAPEAVDSERKVVLSEERLVDNPHYHTVKDEMAFFYKGQPIGMNLPIGEISTLKKMTAADIRAFYERWYRPERATLVVAGDVEPKIVEAKIIKIFSDWRGHEPAGQDPRLGPPLARSYENKNHFEKGISSTATILWAKPFHDGPDSREYEAEDMLRNLAVAAFNQRLQDIAHGHNPPFINASMSYDDAERSLTETGLQISTNDGQLKKGVSKAIEALNDALHNGFTAAEIERQCIVLRRSVDEQVASADKRPTPSLAEGIVAKTNAGEVYIHPRDVANLVEEVLANANDSNVNAAFHRVVSGTGPLLFVTAPREVTGVDKIFLKTLSEKAGTGSGKKSDQTVEWPYRNFGQTGQVTKIDHVDDLDVTLVSFKNGVHLTIKPTSFRSDQVLVNISFGNGRSGFAGDRYSPFWSLDSGGYILGGLDKISYSEIDKILASSSVNASFSIDDNSFRLSGSTRPRDLDVELQLLTAYIAHPGWRPEALTEGRNKMLESLPQLDNSPMSVWRRDAGFYLHNSDKRWKFPDLNDIRQTSSKQMKALLQPSLSSSPIEIAVVGNIAVDQTIEAVARTLGTLPVRPDKKPVDNKNLKTEFPSGNSVAVTLKHNGRVDQSIAFIGWPIPDAIGEWQDLRDLRVLQLILRERLFDAFRTKIGGTYSPSVGIQSSMIFPGYGYFSALVETTPDTIPVFYDTLGQILDDLKNHEVNLDEFDRARKPHIEGIRRSQQTNEYWISMLSYTHSWDRQLDLIRMMIPGLEAVTPGSVREAAGKWLKDDNAWHLVVLPDVKKVD